MDFRSQLMEGMDQKYVDMMEGSTRSPIGVKTTISSLNKFKDNKNAFVNRIKSENQQIKNATKTMKDAAKAKAQLATVQANVAKKTKTVFKRRTLISLGILALYLLYVFASRSTAVFKWLSNATYETSLRWFMPSEGEGIVPFAIAVVLLLTTWIVYWTIAVKTNNVSSMAGIFFGLFFIAGSPVTVVYSVYRLLIFLFPYLFLALLTEGGFIFMSLAAVISILILSRSVLFGKYHQRVITVFALVALLTGIRGVQVFNEYLEANIEYVNAYNGRSRETATVIDGENFYSVNLHKDNGTIVGNSYHYFIYEADETESCVISTFGHLNGRPHYEVREVSYEYGEEIARTVATSSSDEEITVEFEEGKTYYIIATSYMELYDEIRYEDYILMLDFED